MLLLLLPALLQVFPVCPLHNLSTLICQSHFSLVISCGASCRLSNCTTPSLQTSNAHKSLADGVGAAVKEIRLQSMYLFNVGARLPLVTVSLSPASLVQCWCKSLVQVQSLEGQKTLFFTLCVVLLVYTSIAIARRSVVGDALLPEERCKRRSPLGCNSHSSAARLACATSESFLQKLHRETFIFFSVT